MSLQGDLNEQFNGQAAYHLDEKDLALLVAWKLFQGRGGSRKWALEALRELGTAVTVLVERLAAEERVSGCA